MILPGAPPAYDRADQAAVRDALQRAEAESLKRGRDVELGRGRLIVTSPGGLRFVLTVADDGSLATVAL